jgi:hypothetical protein
MFVSATEIVKAVLRGTNTGGDSVRNGRFKS